MDIFVGLKAVSTLIRHPRFVQGHRLSQRFGRLRGRIKSGENHVAVLCREERAFMVGNRETGLLQRRAGHESRFVDSILGVMEVPHSLVSFVFP